MQQTGSRQATWAEHTNRGTEVYQRLQPGDPGSPNPLNPQVLKPDRERGKQTLQWNCYTNSEYTTRGIDA